MGSDVISLKNAGYPHQNSPQRQHSLHTSKWLWATAQATDTCMLLGSNTGHRHPHRPQPQQDHGPRDGPQWQDRPNITMVSGGSIGHSHQYVSQRNHGLQVSTWSLVVTCDTNVILTTSKVQLGRLSAVSGLAGLPGYKLFSLTQPPWARAGRGMGLGCSGCV